MRKELIKHELKKLWTMPMFGIFIVLCLLFNMILIFTNQYGADYVSYISYVSSQIGEQMGAEFDESLALLSESEYKEILLRETQGKEEIYADYDSHEILDIITGLLDIDEMTEKLLKAKYDKFQQKAMPRLVNTKASLSLSAAGMTYDLTCRLFEGLCFAITTECILIAIMAALYLSGYEKLNRTELSVYSTKKGRGIQIYKLLTGIISTAAVYVVIVSVSLAVFNLVYDMGDIWNASMSSQFNHRSVLLTLIPFLTWKPFTVSGYLAAVLALGFVLIVVFYLFGFAAGILLGDAYKAFIVVFTAAILNFLILIITANSSYLWLYQIFQWTPVSVWFNQSLWFTDGDFNTIVPWQECWVVLFCLLLGAVVLRICTRYFYRKDIT